MLMWLATLAHAGLGPDDVMVVYNADSDEAADTAAYYAEARDIPQDQLCGLNGLDPTRRTLPFRADGDDAETLILEPVRACLDGLPHPDDIDAIVLVRGLPYRIDLPDGGYRVSLSHLLQVGRAVVAGTETPIAGQPQRRQGDLAVASVQNPYYVTGGVYGADTSASYGASVWYMTSPRIVRGESTPAPFERVGPREGVVHDFTDELYIVTRLDGFDHADARALVDRGVAADGTFPTAPALCMRGAGGARGVRDGECEHALRMLDAAGFATEWVSAFDGELADKEVVAYWTGAANLRGAIDGVTYVPGAVADNITSFGAAPRNFFCDETGETCPDRESQTSIARFVRAGVTGVQGTVAEPLNNVFPNAGFLLLYTHGYTLGEAWMASQRHTYWVNTYLGDPLTVPFAERPTISLPPEVPANVPVDLLAEHPDGIETVVAYLPDGQRLEADLDLRLPSPEALGLAEGDTVEVLLVATAGPPPAVEGVWPADVAFTPGVKGWATVPLDVGAPQVDAPPPESEPSAGCGCQSAAAPLGIGGWTALPLLVVAARRRRTG